MDERKIEQKLVQAVKAVGGIAPKLVSPGYGGMPDRIVLLPGGKIAFVEVKAMGCKPRPLQLHRHEMLRQLGFRVFVLADAAAIASILTEISVGDDGNRPVDCESCKTACAVSESHIMACAVCVSHKMAYAVCVSHKMAYADCESHKMSCADCELCKMSCVYRKLRADCHPPLREIGGGP